jgi:hypothetical protein
MNGTFAYDLLKVQRKVRKASEAAAESDRMTCWLDDSRWAMEPGEFAYHNLTEEVFSPLSDDKHFNLHWPAGYTYLGPYYFTDPKRAEEARELAKQLEMEAS